MAKKKLIPSYEVSLGEDAGTGKGAIQNIYDTIDDSKISFYEQVERLRQVKTPAGITLYDVMKRFVSKLNDDTVAGVLSFDKGIKSKNFDDGFMGRGFSLQTNEIGEGVLEVDRIHARKEIITDVLTHNKINAIGGTLVVSAAYAEVTRVEVGEDFIKCYYKSDAGGEQMWVQGDIIKLQAGQSRNLTSIVDSVSSEADIYGEHWIDIIFDGIQNVGDSVPVEGDTLVQFGNFDLEAYPERGNVIIIGIGDAVNSYPYIEQYRGVDSFDLTGKLITRISDDVYFGAADQSSYMWWNKDKDNQLKIKGALNVSQSGSLFPTIVFRGAYNSGTTYYKGDVVTHNGTSYIYIYDSPSSNKDPEIATSYWTVFVNSGQSAINNAIVYLYKRSITDVTDTDDIDPALEYNFITGKFSGGSIGTWQYAPYSGGGKLYVTSVFVSADTSVTTVTEPFKTPFEFGHDGDDGRGISSITEQFCLSYSKNAAIGTWVNTQPAWQPLMYMWRRQVITYDDDSVVESAAYLDSSWSVIDNMKIGGDNLSFQNEYDLDATSNNYLYAIIKGENSVTPNIDNVLKNDTEYVLYIGDANKISGSAVSFQIVLYDFITNTDYWTETCSFLDEEFFINIKTPETGKWSLLIYAGMVGATAGNKVTYSNVMLQEGNKATEYNPAYRYLTTALQGDTDITGGIVATNLLMMKDTDGGVTAGISGLESDKVGIWLGGNQSEAQIGTAKTILRKDGTNKFSGKTQIINTDNQNFKVEINPMQQASLNDIINQLGLSTITITANSPVSDYRQFPLVGQFGFIAEAAKNSNSFTLTKTGVAILDLYASSSTPTTVVPTASTPMFEKYLRIKNIETGEILHQVASTSKDTINLKGRFLLPSGTYRLEMYSRYSISAGEYTAGVIQVSVGWSKYLYTEDESATLIGTTGLTIISQPEKYVRMDLKDDEVMKTRGTAMLISEDGTKGIRVTNSGIEVTTNSGSSWKTIKTD